ncbi:hypothetical protein ACIBH1_05345 [Nonomuraea sp. NPDC050663]|uniref:hypothetical protein n=1 Tax=Nonomuraea sp. NPDC050663 TaxID=3364370 RepID=UPI0037B094F2
MSDIPPYRRRCPVYEWCSGRHAVGEDRHQANLDLIEHLEAFHCLVEVNLVGTGGEVAVEVILTDLHNIDSRVYLVPDQAAAIGYILHTFDWRAIRIFGHLLSEGAHDIAPPYGPMPERVSLAPQDVEARIAGLTDAQARHVLERLAEQYPLAVLRVLPPVPLALPPGDSAQS